MSKLRNWQLCLLVLIPLLASFTSAVYPPSWSFVMLPTGATKVHDIATMGSGLSSKCYIATNKGLYMTDFSFTKQGRDWELVKNAADNQYSKEFFDLQAYTGSAGTQLIAWDASRGIGIVKPSNYGRFAMTFFNSASGWSSPSSSNKDKAVSGLLDRGDRIFMMNGNGVVQLCNTNTKNCVLMQTYPSTSYYSFDYSTNRKILTGGKNGKTDFITGASFPQSHRPTAGVSSSAGDIVQVVASRTNNTRYFATKNGYVYKSTDSNAYTWKYYAHGLKPQDVSTTVYSMVKFGQYLYLSTNRGLFYTKTNGTQADWKTLVGMPGWTGKEIKLYSTPTYLVAVNKTQGGVFKKKWLR